MENKDFHYILQDFKRKKEEENLRILEQIRIGDKTEQEREEYLNKYILPCIRLAFSREYLCFLEKFILNGGKLSHYYDYSIYGNMYYALGDFKMIPLYGASSLYILVPEYVNIDFSNGLGHSVLYFLKDGTSTDSFVPVYRDTM